MNRPAQRSLISCGFVAALTWALTLPCLADGYPFLTTDPPVVPAKGEVDALQWFAWNTRHTGESYSAFQAVTEIDYGLTDRLMLAINLQYDWQRTRRPSNPAETDSHPSLSAEVAYVVLPLEPGRFGLAIAVDPAISEVDRGIAFRVLMEKELFGFKNVLNINFETIWERTKSRHWSESSGIGLTYGIAYALTPRWTVALEFNNDRGFESLLLSGTGSASYFAGPTIQYDCELAVVTFGAQAQLPWASGPTAEYGFIPDVERFRLALRFSREI